MIRSRRGLGIGRCRAGVTVRRMEQGTNIGEGVTHERIQQHATNALIGHPGYNWAMKLVLKTDWRLTWLSRRLPDGEERSEYEDTLALPRIVTETIHHPLVILDPELVDIHADALVRDQIHRLLQILLVAMQPTDYRQITEDDVVEVEFELFGLGDDDYQSVFPGQVETVSVR